MKVLIIGQDITVGRLFEESGHEVFYTGPLVAERCLEVISTSDLMVFTGGEDVSPVLYGQRNTNSFTSLDRDLREMIFYHAALANDVPMMGICRGGQFLNVMNGGTMIQDYPGHTRDHSITYLGQEVFATSTHHQVMVASPKADLWAFGHSQEETEILYYSETMSMCFQPHPEYPRASQALKSCFFDCVEQITGEI